jgi:hypothetical protein
MYLDQDDFAVFSHYFSEASQVFLLVRPSTEGPAMGGFFFWEDGDVNRSATYRQFPFDCARLAEGNYPITGGQPVARRRRVRTRARAGVGSEAEARARRRLPSLPWVVVPVIAVLFLIAGLFVSENQTPVRESAVVEIQPARRAFAAGAGSASGGRDPGARSIQPPPVAEPAPVATPKLAVPKSKPRKRLAEIDRAPAGHGRPRAGARNRAAAGAGRSDGEVEPKLAAVLPVAVSAAPPPEAESELRGSAPRCFPARAA